MTYENKPQKKVRPLKVFTDLGNFWPSEIVAHIL